MCGSKRGPASPSSRGTEAQRPRRSAGPACPRARRENIRPMRGWSGICRPVPGFSRLAARRPGPPPGGAGIRLVGGTAARPGRITASQCRAPAPCPAPMPRHAPRSAPAPAPRATPRPAPCATPVPCPAPGAPRQPLRPAPCPAPMPRHAPRSAPAPAPRATRHAPHPARRLCHALRRATPRPAPRPAPRAGPAPRPALRARPDHRRRDGEPPGDPRTPT
jgi:hypothetical protein